MEVLTTVLVSLIITFLAIVAIAFVHEFGHFLAGKVVGIKMLRFVFGTLDPGRQKPKFRVKVLGVPWEYYSLPVTTLGIMIDNQSFIAGRGWRLVTFALAGPMANLVSALALAIATAGVVKGLYLFAELFRTVGQLVGAFFFGWMGLFGGSRFIFEGAFASLPKLIDQTGVNSVVVTIIALSLFMVFVNLLPLSGTDGGWLVMNLKIKILSRFSRKSNKEVAEKTFNETVRWSRKWLMKTIIIGGTGLFLINLAVYAIPKLLAP
jgi:membrane-associated protease RseP (regulator of RpoE activity)